MRPAVEPWPGTAEPLRPMAPRAAVLEERPIAPGAAGGGTGDTRAPPATPPRLAAMAPAPLTTPAPIADVTPAPDPEVGVAVLPPP